MGTRAAVILIFGLAIFFCVPLSQVLRADEAPTAGRLTVAQVLHDVQGAEQSIANLQVQRFETHVGYGPSQDGPWKRSQDSFTGTGWYAGLLGSKARVNLKSVETWVGGSSPWLEAEDELGFDGQYGRVAHDASGPTGKIMPIKRGEILPDAPSMLNTSPQAFADGRAFSLQFYGSAFGHSLSGLVGNALSHGQPVNVAVEGRDGVSLARVEVHDGTKGRDTFWLDPSRGWSLIEEEATVARGGQDYKCFRRIKVDEVREAGAGAWYPLRASLEMDMGQTDGWIRYDYSAGKVIANDPDFDDAVFTIHFPKGFRVTDRVNNTSFVAGGAADEMAKRIDDSIRMIRAATPLIRLDPQPAPALGAQSPPSAARRTSIVVAAIACAVLAFSLVCWLSFRRLRRGSAALLLLPMGLFSQPLRADVLAPDRRAPATLPASDDARVNCGVNVGYFTLRWFDIPAKIRDVGVRLGVGPEFERPCSLADLKTLFESKGLHVDALKADSNDGIVTRLVPDVVAVVRTSRTVGGKETAHFLSLLRTSAGFVIVDPPLLPSQVSSAEFLEKRVLAHATGEFLLVARPTPATTQSSAEPLTPAVVDLGEVPFNGNSINVPHSLPQQRGGSFARDGGAAGCTCLGDYTGDMVVPAGGDGIITVHFKKEKFPPGANEPMVLLVTDAPAHPYQPVKVRFVVPGTPNPAKLSVVPRQIDYGRVSSEKLMVKPTEVTLQLPPSVAADGILGFSATSPSAHLRVEQVGKPTTNPFRDGKLQQFSVSWDAAPPSGLFEETFSLVVKTSKSTDHVSVTVRGYIEPSTVSVAGTTH